MGVQGKWKGKEEKCHRGHTLDQEEVQLSGLWSAGWLWSIQMVLPMHGYQSDKQYHQEKTCVLLKDLAVLIPSNLSLLKLAIVKPCECCITNLI